MNLIQKLIAVRKKLDYFKKDAKGSKSSYVDPEILLGKVVKYLNEHSILLSTNIGQSSVDKVSAPTSNNKDQMDFMAIFDMEMVWINADDPEDKLNVKWFGVGSHMTDPAMAFGGALTYTERYFMMKQFNIPTGKDDPEFHKAKIEDPVFITEENAMDLRSMITEKGRDEVKFCSFFKVAKVEDLFLCNYEKAVSMLERVK